MKQEEARQAEDFCESTIVRVIDCLQKQYLSVRELIGAQAEAAAAQVHISLQAVELKMEEIKKTDAELDSLAQTDSNVHFLEVLHSCHWTLELCVGGRSSLHCSISFFSYRNGHLCGISVKKTISSLPTRTQKIHFSPLRSQRLLLNSLGETWRNSVRKNFPKSLTQVYVFADSLILPNIQICKSSTPLLAPHVLLPEM